MLRNKKSQKKNEPAKILKREFDYLISLDKEYKKSTRDQRNVQYTVNEGDMGSVKTIDITPVTLQDNPSLV